LKILCLRVWRWFTRTGAAHFTFPTLPRAVARTTDDLPAVSARARI